MEDRKRHIRQNRRILKPIYFGGTTCSSINLPLFVAGEIRWRVYFGCILMIRGHILKILLRQKGQKVHIKRLFSCGKLPLKTLLLRSDTQNRTKSFIISNFYSIHWKVSPENLFFMGSPSNALQNTTASNCISHYYFHCIP